MSDADGSWPADPTDPRCPACGGPVSATADFCMHCHEDLPTATDGTAAVPSDTDAADSTPDGEAARASRDREATRTTAGQEPTDAERGWLHPDGPLDDSLTLLVGVAAGVVAGILAASMVVFALPGGWPFLVGVVAWVAVTVAAGRSRSVFGAAMTGSYLLAMALVALPVVLASTAPMAEPGTGERLGFAVVLAVFCWPTAGVLAFVGRWLGRRGPGGNGSGSRSR